ncbi:MAG: PIG-L family deacetylase [Candidatus Pacebacteria bacterium]|jgi:LmbE family N-acetylglucosaminyl deacetylase|nr:PIG-L family deacetylase [Candidatus Paceibacterota bacterium]
MKVLAIGSHPDDIEIGCGGALLRHRAQGDEVKMLVLTPGGRGGESANGSLVLRRMKEQVAAAELMNAQLILWDYTDTEIPETYALVERIEKIVNEFKPDRVYLPYGHDTHQDHRVTSNVAKSACRKVKQVLEYEEPSSYNSFTANYWIDITPYIEKKLEAIKLHTSQGHKEILKARSIEGLNLYRGYQSQVEYAEGFSAFRFLE